MKYLGSFYHVTTEVKRIIARLTSLEQRVAAGSGSSGGGATQIYAGSAAPNGVQTATGPAIYLMTVSVPPTLYFKTSSGTSNNEWQ